jgi:hypothetical protein
MKTKIFAAVLAVTALTACSKSSKNDPTITSAAASAAASDKGGIKGSCNLRKENGNCSEETEKSDPMGLSKGLCEALKGTWSEGKCPQDNLVGSCTDKDGSTIYYYSDGPTGRDVDDAKSSCEVINEGKFTALAQPKPLASDPPKHAAAPAAAPKAKPAPSAKPKH